MSPEEMPGVPAEEPSEESLPEESRGTYRNHPTVLADNLISGAIGGFFIILIAGLTGRDLVVGTAVFAGLTFAVAFVYWLKTEFEFHETEMVRNRNTVSKSVKRIQYNRLASVEVRRTITNHIFGTSTLMFNVNSGVNATVSEATLVLKRDEADALRDRLSSMIFHKEVTVEEDREIETLVEVSNLDIILHATLAQPTYQAIFGLVMLVYAILSLFQENSGGFLSAVVLFAITEAIPFIQVILKYANYRLYRVGDTVTVESGLLSTSRRSFRTNKVNSVRVREPMLARIIGKATLDAEVVGLAGGEGVPILCPLKKKAVVEDLANKLVPELVFEPEPEHQPARAIYPMIITDAVVSVISIAIGVWLFLNVNSRPDVNSFAETLLLLVEALFIVGIPLYRFGGSLLHQRQRMFAMGTESFMFVSGAFDMSTEYVSFDKVQIAAVRAGPLQRRFGLATCRVSQLSSVGFRSVESGLFPPEDLEAVPDEVMARIRDGRYDYRRYLRWYRTCL